MSVEKFDPNIAHVVIQEKARVHLQRQLDDEPSAVGIRFTVAKTGCSGYSYVSELMTEVTEDDIRAENNVGMPIYMSEKAKSLINGIVVDFVEQALGQKKLTYLNPNETARCGCGESFSIEKRPDEGAN